MRRLKSILLGWLHLAAVRVPPRLGVYIMNRTWPRAKRPVLDYLEFHLADHCNLNCAGCFHFSPFAEKRFADLETVKRDFARLGGLFRNIRHIRIMGGEPFLHPEMTAFARVVREAFPKAKTRVATNGLLLAGAGRETVLKLRELAALGVGLDWTLYPVMAAKEGEIVKLCREAGIDLRISRNDSFWARLLPRGDGGVRRSFRWCREHLYCPILDSGRIYLCAQAHFAPYYNRAAGTEIFEDRGIDIHTAGAMEILDYLMRPSFACRFCAAGKRELAWKQCTGPEDWVR